MINLKMIDLHVNKMFVNSAQAYNYWQKMLLMLVINQCRSFFVKVFACHRRNPKEFPPSFPQEIEQKPPFVRITKDAIVFADGTSEKVDAIVFCTGSVSYTHLTLPTICSV